MKLHTFFILGRISNLPTVWTNLLAASVLALTIDSANVSQEHSGLPLYEIIKSGSAGLFFLLLLAGSLFYLGGMLLNDAFDAKWDKAHNNPRPIPLGLTDKKTVLVLGWSLLIGAVAAVIGITVISSTVDKITLFLSAFALFLSIVAYDLWHKDSPHSVILMGLCRGSLYAVGAATFGVFSAELVLASASLVLYIAGLTYFARNEHRNKIQHQWPILFLAAPLFVAVGLCINLGENLLLTAPFASLFLVWIGIKIKPLLTDKTPNIRASVGGLLAAIPLIDALLLSAVNAWAEALLCVCIFACIPLLHRWVSGT